MRLEVENALAGRHRLAGVVQTEPEGPVDRLLPEAVSRPSVAASQDQAFFFGPFRLQPVARRLENAGARVELGDRALDILVLLVRRAGTIIPAHELMTYAWRNMTVDEGNLRVRMVELRRALNDLGRRNAYIANVRGQGYCFVGFVETESRTLAPCGRVLPQQRPDAFGAIEIELPSGLKLRLTGDVDKCRLHKLVEVLSDGQPGCPTNGTQTVNDRYSSCSD